MQCLSIVRVKLNVNEMICFRTKNQLSIKMTCQSLLHVKYIQRTESLCSCFMVIQKMESVRPNRPFAGSKNQSVT